MWFTEYHWKINVSKKMNDNTCTCFDIKVIKQFGPINCSENS